MFITRVGTNTRVFITGDDTAQCDLKVPQNGLQWLVQEIKRQHLPVELIEFRNEDCVRSELCKMMLNMISRSE